jgi:hypothetical protein
MVDINTVYKSQHNKWKAEDLNGQAYDMVIARVEIIDFEDGAKACVYFRGDERGLVLNITNKNALVEMFGTDTDGWVNQTVTMYSVPTTYQGRPTTGIRLMRPIVHVNATPQPNYNQPAPQQFQAPADNSHVLPQPTAQRMPEPQHQDYSEINPPPVTEYDR